MSKIKIQDVCFVLIPETGSSLFVQFSLVLLPTDKIVSTAQQKKKKKTYLMARMRNRRSAAINAIEIETFFINFFELKKSALLKLTTELILEFNWALFEPIQRSVRPVFSEIYESKVFSSTEKFFAFSSARKSPKIFFRAFS